LRIGLRTMKGRKFQAVIPGREQSERARNLEIPGLVLRTIPE